jgi:NAD(P)-dependent dehydrogenase (short-subunit alcohol dehydrogenase family)
MARRALVTGANRGIGRAVAGHLVDAGLEVLVAARDRAAGEEAAREVGAAGAVTLDVTDEASVRAAAARAGAVDVLVNNAAILDEGEDVLAQDAERVDALVQTNLVGPWRTIRAFVPGMVERRFGRVVNVSSGAGSFAAGLWSAAPGYSITKAALNALTVVVAAQTRGTGVLVNAADPGVVGTRMAPSASTSPEDAARPIARLALLDDGGPTGGFWYRGREEPW